MDDTCTGILVEELSLMHTLGMLAGELRLRSYGRGTLGSYGWYI